MYSYDEVRIQETLEGSNSSSDRSVVGCNRSQRMLSGHVTHAYFATAGGVPKAALLKF